MNKLKLIYFLLVACFLTNQAIAKNINLEEQLINSKIKENIERLVDCYPKPRQCPLPFI